MVFSNCRDWGSASGPFLHTPISGLPEALLSNRFAADRGCGSCLGLQSYRELCLLGSMGLLPQNIGLLVKELIQGGYVSSHLVQRVFFMAAPFQTPHACFPSWGPDGRREE